MRIALLNNRLAAGLLTAAFVAMAAHSAQAQEKDRYVMNHPTSPTRISPYSSTVYTANARRVATMRGDELHFANKDTILSFQINPAGFNYLIVEKGKKASKATIYNVVSPEDRSAKFDVKKYGQPVAAAFTPDARNVVIATDRAIYVCDPVKMIPQRQMARISFVPDHLCISGNGYYLAAIKGDRCDVFNLENGNLRKQLTPGATITDAAFSPDNSDFALLTDDGLLTIYSTQTFAMRKMVDDLGEGLAMAYNFDGKYIAVAENEGEIVVVNLLNDSDRETFGPASGSGVSDVSFIPDAYSNTLMAYTATNAIEARRLHNLKPYYNKLIKDETDAKMAEWLKMMPDETIEQYRQRVNEKTRSDKRRMFEYEISTRLAGDLLGGSAVSLGTYDRANGVLAISFDKMPTIFLPVPEDEVTQFKSPSDVTLEDVLFGVNPDDSFEIVYARVINRANNKAYVFDNRDRAPMNYMNNDDAISLEALQQQQMEELKLQELRRKVMEEAKSRNVISDHTNITVDSRIVPEINADGERVLNYVVSFSYDVSPGFSAQEDFGPGKYRVEDSGAATSMLKIVKEAFEGDLRQYLQPGTKMRVALTGTADATPIVHGIPYDGIYGDFANEPVYIDDQLSTVNISSREPIKENPQLAFLRAMCVKDFMEKNVEGYNDINKDYRYEISVSSDKGSEYRRISAVFTFLDALK